MLGRDGRLLARPPRRTAVELAAITTRRWLAYDGVGRFADEVVKENNVLLLKPNAL